MRPVVLTFAAIAFLVAPPTTSGGDMEDLKAATEQLLKALNSRDADAIMALHDDRAIGFAPTSAFPIDHEQAGKAASLEGWRNLFGDLELFNLTLINPTYRVIGSTGIVVGHGRDVIKPKDGPRETRYRRVTFIFTKSGGKWLRISWHVSPIPSGS